MEKKPARLIATILAFVLMMSFVFFATGTVLAQDGQQEQEGGGTSGDIPPELQAKVREFREAAADLRKTAAPIKGDVREFKRTLKGMMRKARSIPRDARRDLFDRVSALRDQYAGAVKEKIAAIKECAGAIRDATAASREAWEQEDLDGALSGLDQAIAKVAELKPLLEDAHQLFEEIIDALRSIAEETGAPSASSTAFAA
jgi:SepF-like predicted cell division protein (DUF552 family)